MRIITRTEVERLLPVEACIPVMREAMVATSRRNVSLPIRQFMPIPGVSGKLALMPGTLGDPACFGIKLVCKYERPHNDPLGTHVGMVVLFDSAAGIPLALIEGSSLTAIRTAAASALATDVLARSDASSLAILGTGEQAMRHLHAMCRVRPVKRVSIWGRNQQRAADFVDRMSAQSGLSIAFADTVSQAVRDADIICTTTSAASPILSGGDISPGTHVNLVGSAIASTAEVDDEAVRRSRYFVDYREAAMAAAGELLTAIRTGVVTADHVLGEIGDVIEGRVAGRTSPADVTLYKSLGIAAQDLAAAHAIWQLAECDSAGMTVDLMD